MSQSDLVPVRVDVNGIRQDALVEARLLAVDFLRDRVLDHSVHVGCDTAQCGACTVLVDGAPAKSCNLLTVQLDEASVLTARGLAATEGSEALLRAFETHHAVQCGFCTPGMLMIAAHLLDESDDALSSDRVRAELHGNLCRCTGYENIVEAICAASTGARR